MPKEPTSNMGAVHPHCLPPAPTREALAAVAAGDFVKIIRVRERFWCLVTSRAGDQLTGEVNNDLVHTPEHGICNGDVLTFPLADVIQIEKAEASHGQQTRM